MSNLPPEKTFHPDFVTFRELTDESLLSNDREEPVAGKKYITFVLDTTHFAIDSNKVAEVVRPLNFTVLPNFPAWLSGIANLRGEILSIIDLQAIWKMNAADSPKSKLIVLRSGSQTASHIAFKVDKLREIVTLPDEEIDRAGADDLPFLAGKVIHRSNLINLLDIEKILSSLKLI